METFFKYHGLGNDFVVIDRRATGVDIDADVARRWCDRHFGIGADGVLAVLPEPGADGRMVVHNADGSIAEMCGNGLRCVARFLAERAQERPDALRIATGAGLLRCEIGWTDAGAETITVAMGPARLVDGCLPSPAPHLKRPIAGAVGTAISMGNPHYVLFDEPASQAARLGPALEINPAFVQRTNVEFVEPRAGGGLRVTVWERGVGLTLACGIGACAAVAAWALDGRVPFDAWVPVELPGGVLAIRVAQDLSQVWLRGPAAFVFAGQVA